ncbi:helix-turn-helix domain-containing protein [Streptomyces sp. NPDC017546]|uniref:helix-turn-helix domain-containing protein n=1 Tax=unclassified Streptomyces TaxID=2593676 RepID=UPI00235E4E48|nr:helix-turn-helix domain-containing protein [Streptomyces sp. MMBL 11-1]
MPVALARSISLIAAERHRLKKVACGHKTEHRLGMRAQIVLHAARGRSNAQIDRQTGLHLDTVRRWRGRFAEARLESLADRKRSGRPGAFTALRAASVTALTCRLPAESGVPISRWSAPELAREAIARGIATFLSASTVRRWLAQDVFKPWQHRSWISITDPDFRPKAQRVLELYAYGSGGAMAYLAADDVQHAKVFGRTEPRTGIDPFMNLVTQVMSREPYASAKRVFWIVDNGSSPAARSRRPVDQGIQHSRLRGSSPPPTWMICWPGSTGTPPITRQNPPAQAA